MAAEILPWLNLLLVPAVGYLWKLERRVHELEAFLRYRCGLGDDCHLGQ